MYPSELCDKSNVRMNALDTDDAFVPVAADGMTLAMDSIPSVTLSVVELRHPGIL
jgi:hypothetical protein